MTGPLSGVDSTGGGEHPPLTAEDLRRALAVIDEEGWSAVDRIVCHPTTVDAPQPRLGLLSEEEIPAETLITADPAGITPAEDDEPATLSEVLALASAIQHELDVTLRSVRTAASEARSRGCGLLIIQQAGGPPKIEVAPHVPAGQAYIFDPRHMDAAVAEAALRPYREERT